MAAVKRVDEAEAVPPPWRYYRLASDPKVFWAVRVDPPFIEQWHGRRGGKRTLEPRRLRPDDDAEALIDAWIAARIASGFVFHREVSSESPLAPESFDVEAARERATQRPLAGITRNKLLDAIARGDQRALFAMLGTKVAVDTDYVELGIPFHCVVQLFPGAAALDVVSELLDAGADPSALAAAGMRPLGAACARAFHAETRDQAAAMVAMLIARGAEVDALDGEGSTALHLALSNPWAGDDVLRALLDAGASVEARDADGLTPLHLAITSGLGSLPRVELLVAHGADVRAATPDGYAPVELARSVRGPGGAGHDIAELLVRLAPDAAPRVADGLEPLVALVRAGPYRADPPEPELEPEEAMEPPLPDHPAARAMAAALVGAVRATIDALGGPARALLDPVRVSEVDSVCAAAIDEGRVGRAPLDLRVEGRPLLSLLIELGLPQTLGAALRCERRPSARAIREAILDASHGPSADVLRSLLAVGGAAGELQAAGEDNLLYQAASAGRLEHVRVVLESITDPQALTASAEQALFRVQRLPRTATNLRIAALLRRAYALAGGGLGSTSLEGKRRKRMHDVRSAVGCADFLRACRDRRRPARAVLVGAAVADVSRARAARGGRLEPRAESHAVPWDPGFEGVFSWAGASWTILVTEPAHAIGDPHLAAAELARALACRAVAIDGVEASEHAGDGSLVERKRGDLDRWLADRGAFLCAHDAIEDGLRSGLVLGGVRRQDVERLDLVVTREDPWAARFEQRDHEVLGAVAALRATPAHRGRLG